MKRRDDLRLFVWLLAICLLGGCGKSADYPVYRLEPNRVIAAGTTDGTTGGTTGGTTDGGTTDGGTTEEKLPSQDNSAGRHDRGSVNLVEGKTVLVTVFVNESCSNWTDEKRSYVSFAQKTSAEYIMQQAKNCGKNSEIIVWDSEHPDLVFEMSCEGALKASLTDEFQCDELLSQAREKTVDLDAIARKYGTDSIGTLFILDGDTTNTSYTTPYDPVYNWCYSEFCTMYMIDCDIGGMTALPVFAHEMLHLFGAIDLYEADEYSGVTDQVVQYFERYMSNELMYDTFEADGSNNYTGISQKLSDLTLAKLGLIDPTEVAKQFPTIDFSTPGYGYNIPDTGYGYGGAA